MIDLKEVAQEGYKIVTPFGTVAPNFWTYRAKIKWFIFGQILIKKVC